MSRKNKQKQGCMNAGGDINGSSIKLNKSNQNIINKEKRIDLYKEEYKLDWANPENSDALLYTRLPNINDRPMLEKYYHLLVKNPLEEFSQQLTFIAYVANRRNGSKYFVITNILDEYGRLVSMHCVVKCPELSEYKNKLIKFKGCVYRYIGEDEYRGDKLIKKGEAKYGISINSNSIDQIYEKDHDIIELIWNKISEENPNYNISLRDVSDKYNKLNLSEKQQVFESITYLLDMISFKMFGTTNMITPTILSMFLMRDDIYNETIINSKLRHLNILYTLVAEYIVEIVPETYEEMYKIITYVVMNYLGYDLNKPNDKEKFYDMVKDLGVTKTNADHYKENVRQNVGGFKKLIEFIPEHLRTKPGEIHRKGLEQFVKRLLFDGNMDIYEIN